MVACEPYLTFYRGQACANNVSAGCLRVGHVEALAGCNDIPDQNPDEVYRSIALTFIRHNTISPPIAAAGKGLRY
ncbi:hypothetical protein GCM10011395_25690 [Sphingomonas psychrolutea]|uniref:Uncharacterized protein n=1 Tax=Sphingomonas psychrolutea TaxID=1259676 RepID=A0ABQ1H005_9SPHN|nr:hypothetical protein GCM10011395_25690 [Sphingomonas psychrolutea]